MKKLKDILDYKQNVHRSVEPNNVHASQNTTMTRHHGSNYFQSQNTTLNKSGIYPNQLNKSSITSSGLFGTAPRFKDQRDAGGNFYELKSQLSNMSKSFAKSVRPGIINHH